MKPSPKKVGVLLALVVCTLLLVGWPGPEEAASAGLPSAEDEVPPTFIVEDGVWKLPMYGLCMSPPADWTPIERLGRPYLYKEVQEPLGGSFNVLMLPNMRGHDMEGLREENRVTIEESEKLELISIEDATVTDLPALRLEYRGTTDDGEVMHFVGIVLLDMDGMRQVVVTSAARESEWEELEGTLLASLESLARLPRLP